MDIVDLAKTFAHGAHGAIDQRRRYTLEPYINHLAAVVAIVNSVTSNAETLAAAWLHDVVEDTAVNNEDIRHMFGNEVADYVFYLTDPPVIPGGPNRAARCRETRERLAIAPGNAQTVKLADLIDNTASIMQYDRNFAKTYVGEKAELLDVLTKGSKFLHFHAQGQLRKYKFDLESSND